MSTRFLCLKMDHLGDALWAFPAIESLRSAYPSATVDMLCSPYLADVFTRCTFLDDVLTYDPSSSWSDRFSFLRRLRSRRYDTAIVLGPVDKINHLAYASGARRRIGFSYAGNPIRAVSRMLFLTQSAPHPADVALKDGHLLPHEVNAMLSLALLAGGAPCESPRLSFSVLPSEHEMIDQLFTTHLLDHHAVIGLHLCAKAFADGWRNDSFISLAKEIVRAFPQQRLIVTAGPTEKPYLNQYHKPLHDLGVPVFADLKLGQMAALLSKLSVLTSWDTGMVHLATAVGTPVVDVFPSRNAQYCIQRWGPWGMPQDVVIQPRTELDHSVIEDILTSIATILCVEKKGSHV